MTAPIILPPLRRPISTSSVRIVMTIVMEMGSFTTVGLNIFVIRNVAPDIPCATSSGHAAFVLLMMLAVCAVLHAGNATYLPIW